MRHGAIRDVLLTNADFDHVLGLFLLRERGEPLRVHCTAAVRDTLSANLKIDTLLAPFCGVEWRELSPADAALGSEPEIGGGLAFRAIPLPGGPPRYAAATTAPTTGGQSVALEFIDPRRDGDEGGRRLLVAPDVAAITPALQSALGAADAVLFDGTFWSEDELRRVDPAATRTATDMGHLPIASGSLERLRNLPARHRVYTHVNNTNPILAPDSPERAAVEHAGVVVGEDGMSFEL